MRTDLPPRLRPTPRPFARAALVAAVMAALAAGLFAGGCNPKPTGPATFDNGGGHLVVFASDRNQAAGQFRIYLYDLDLLGFRLLASLTNSAYVDSSPSITSD